jgi:cytochrome c-type biogenesis protein
VDPLILVTALAAGLVSFASPCVLPLVPAYVGYITGRSAEELRGAAGSTRLAVTRQALAFVLGLTLIFALLGATATLLGQTLLANLPLLWKVGGAIVIVFGLQMLGVLRLPLLARSFQPFLEHGQASTGAAGAFLIGLAFGAGWTPCVGPFLAGVLALASSATTVSEGTLLLVVYAFGLGIPFVLAGLALDQTGTLLRALKPHLLAVERASGLLLIAMGVLLFTERLTLVTAWLTRIFGTGLAL